jgi:hypothetical protein
MAVMLEILNKSQDQVQIFFEKQPTSTVASVNLYVSLTDVTANFVEIIEGIVNTPYDVGGGDSKNVYFRVTIAELQALGGAFANASFDGTPLYLRATTVSPAGVESAIASSQTKFIGVVGFNPLPEQDNPAQNNHNYMFSNQALYWDRTRGTALGAQQVSSNPYYEDNIVIDRVIVANMVTQELYYPAGAPSGARAKLVVYTGPFSVDGKATKVEYSDTTLP